MPTSNLMIGIAGGSCSGKSTLENNLVAKLGGEQVATFPFDDLFVGLEALSDKHITDWEDPALYRWDDYRHHMRQLRLGKQAVVIANSRESVEAGITSRIIQPKPVVVAAGFLALHNSSINNFFDTTVFIDLPEEEIIRRRLARAKPDDPWDSMEYISSGLIIKGHRKYVDPQRARAQHVLDGTLSPAALTEELVQVIQDTKER